MALGLTTGAPLAQEGLPSPTLPRPLELPEPPPAEREEPEITIEPPARGAPPGAEELMVELRALEIEGSSVYSDEELRGFYGDLIGQTIPLARLFGIASAIEDKYREDGYPLVRVIVPAQVVQDGLFRIQVIEGYVNDVRLEGEVGPVRGRIQAILDRIVGVRPVSNRVLERYLLLANDLPGISASGVLRPGTGERGAAQLVVKVERKPFDAYGVVNNRGSKFTGPWRAVVVGAENAATALGERVQITGAATPFTDEQYFVQGHYQQPLGTDGLEAHAVGQYEATNPGSRLSDIDLETEVVLGGGFLSYPLLRSRRQNLYAEVGFEALRTEVDALGARLSRDDLRVLRALLAYDFRDDLGGSSTLSFGVRQGLDVLGASDENDSDLSRPEGEPDFTTFQFTASRLQPLTDPLALFVAAKGQVALDTLLTYEEFTVGGERFGRGYDPAELAGEDGVGLSAEVQYNGSTNFSQVPAYQVYGFYDYGAVWNDDTGVDDHDSLSSAGGGVRTQVFKNFFLEFEVAKPLTRKRESDGDKSAQFFFQASARF